MVKWHPGKNYITRKLATANTFLCPQLREAGSLVTASLLTFNNQATSQIKSIIPVPTILPVSLGQPDLSGRAENSTYDSGNPRKLNYKISPFYPNVVKYNIWCHSERMWGAAIVLETQQVAQGCPSAPHTVNVRGKSTVTASKGRLRPRSSESYS